MIQNNSSSEIEKKLRKINWTPLHTRFLAHRIGDGSVNHYGHYEYNNKHVDEFLALSKLLNIKVWGPYRSDKYGTKKVVTHKKSFQDFASLFSTSSELIIKHPKLLLNIFHKLPKSHKLQSINAFIVDDGSCKSWLLSLFVDQNIETSMSVKYIWDSLCPNTSSHKFCITPKGTKICRLFANRNGILSYHDQLYTQIKKYGSIAGLWWKQSSFENRVSKAKNSFALKLNETKENHEKWEAQIIDLIKNIDFVKFTDLKDKLNLSKDRLYLILKKLASQQKIFIVHAGNRSYYSLKYVDISFTYRKEKIIQFIKQNRSIRTKDVCQLFNLKAEQSQKILRQIQDERVIKREKNLYLLI